MLARACDNKDFSVSSPSGSWKGNLIIAAQVARRDRPPVCNEFLLWRSTDYLTAFFTRQRTQFDQIVGGLHHLAVVFDDDHRVALDCQLSQNAGERRGVTRVETDGRFVEDVERADQTGAELIGQGCSLGLSSRERAGLAGECQIAEAHAEEKAKLGRQLSENVAGDLLFIGREGEGCDPRGSFFDREIRHLMNVFARDSSRSARPVGGGIRYSLGRGPASGSG